MKKTTWIIGVVVLALAGGGAWWWTQRAKASDMTYRTGKLERGNLAASVSASGAVNPVKQVSVGTQVSGQIKEIFVDFNSEVKAGQLLAQIDPETLEYRVRQSLADVDAARAAVLTAQANMAASNAAISRAQVDVQEAKRDAERQQSLVDQQFVAQSVADRARALVNTTSEQLKAAQAQLGVTQAQIKSAQANVQQREAALAQARIDLERTRITSPVDGIVIKRAIEKGQTVAASLQAPELFVIAQNLSDMQVDASVDESDIGRIRAGQKASFTVDAFPGQTFDGEVRQVRKAAQNVANVITYVAVVGFTNTGNRLLPGMTANVRVVTDQRENVLKVPNAALRVKIAGNEPAAPAGGASGASNSTSNSAPSNAPSNTGSATNSVAAYADKTRDSGQNNAKNTAETAPAAQGGGAGGGGQWAEQRARMAAELQFTPEQQAKVDAIYTDARPRFMALRDLPEEERAKARERITADLRARVGELLTPDQKPKYAALQAEMAGRSTSRGRIYLLGADDKPVAYNVRLGITDGTSTELVLVPNAPNADVFKEAATVVVGVSGGAAAGASGGASGQRAGGPGAIGGGPRPF
jgi:HlyD family secretion protein